MTLVAPPTTSSPAAPATPERELGRWIAGPALAAAITELVLLRLTTRSAIHIPGIEAVAGPYRAVSITGRYAHHAAAVLVAVTLVLLARLLAARGHRVQAAAVGAVVVASAAARLDVIDRTALTLAVGAAVVALTASVAVSGGKRLAVPIGLFAAAFVASTVHAVVQDLAGTGDLRPRSTIGLLVVAEVMLVVAALVLPGAVHARDRRAVAVGAGVGVVVFGAMAGSSATTRILLLWTFGLPGYLPAVVYAVVAGFLAAGLLGARRDSRDLAVGLGFLVAGGIGLQDSYQSALVVCGLAMLALWSSEPGEASRQRARTVSIPAR